MKKIYTYNDFNSNFLTDMDPQFRMRSPEWLKERMASAAPLFILDLRSPEAFNAAHIEGSINVLLSSLPKEYALLIPDRKAAVVAACSGSVQSAYAIMFLYSRGYRDVFNLSGGFSRWEKEGYPVVR